VKFVRSYGQNTTSILPGDYGSRHPVFCRWAGGPRGRSGSGLGTLAPGAGSRVASSRGRCPRLPSTSSRGPSRARAGRRSLCGSRSFWRHKPASLLPPAPPLAPWPAPRLPVAPRGPPAHPRLRFPALCSVAYQQAAGKLVRPGRGWWRKRRVQCVRARGRVASQRRLRGRDSGGGHGPTAVSAPSVWPAPPRCHRRRRLRPVSPEEATRCPARLTPAWARADTDATGGCAKVRAALNRRAPPSAWRCPRSARPPPGPPPASCRLLLPLRREAPQHAVSGRVSIHRAPRLLAPARPRPPLHVSPGCARGVA